MIRQGPWLTFLQMLYGVRQLLVLASCGVAIFMEPFVDPGQQVREGRQAVARLRRKIGAGKKRRQVVRVEEQRQRPSASALREQLVRKLVNLVEVRPFFAAPSG